jgi:hypothetical protein
MKMTYSWLQIPTIGFELNEVYINRNSINCGSVTQRKGVITAFACDGKRIRLQWKGVPSLTKARQLVAQQYGPTLPKTGIAPAVTAEFKWGA